MFSRISIGILILLACTFWVGAAQQDNKPPVKKNLYAVALFASLEKMSKEWGRFGQTDYHQMIVESSEITRDLPAKFESYQVTYLDSTGMIERYRKSKKSFAVLVAHPAQSEGERIQVSYTLHWVSYKNRRLQLGLSDWSTVYFRLDRERREYVVDEVVLGGI